MQPVAQAVLAASVGMPDASPASPGRGVGLRVAVSGVEAVVLSEPPALGDPQEAVMLTFAVTPCTALLSLVKVKVSIPLTVMMTWLLTGMLSVPVWTTVPLPLVM